MTRLFLRTFAAAFVMTAVLTGCEPADEAPPADVARETPAAELPAAVDQSLRWESMGSGEGSALVLLEADGDRLFQLACLRAPDRLSVEVDGFTTVGSEERLTLGVGGEAYALVADATRQGPGVHAEGPIDADLLTRMLTTQQISAVYGAQRLGPHPAPEDQARQAFVTTCRSIAAGEEGA